MPSARSTPTPTPTPRVTPTPLATPTSTPFAAPAPLPASTPVASAPMPVAPPLEPPPRAVAPADSGDYTVPARSNIRFVVVGIVGLAMLAALGWLALLLVRRRRQLLDDREIAFEVAIDESTPATAIAPARGALRGEPDDLPFARAPEPPPPSIAPPPPIQPPPSFLRPKPVTPVSGPRAKLEIAVSVLRAGSNLTSAAVDYEIELRNAGDAAARGIRMDIRLLSASADQDAVLASVFSAPVDKPAVAPFDLAPDSVVSLGGMAMLPKEALSVLSVQGKPFFIPVLTINALYHWEPGEPHGGSGQTASAHVVGIDRGDDAKMAPFRLDGGPRMYDDVAQRRHEFGVQR